MDAVEFKDGNKPWINHLVLTKNFNFAYLKPILNRLQKKII